MKNVFNHLKNCKAQKGRKGAPKPVSYRQLRPDNLCSCQYRHLLLCLFWVIYGIVFTLIERYLTAERYYPMHCALDDWIPFCELFIIPYTFWYFYLLGAHLFLLRYDIAAFRKMMLFFIITYAYAILFCFFFPNCQELRPEHFARNNLLTRLTGLIYAADTNTNVSPSMHVLGTLAATFALWNTDRFRTKQGHAALAVITVLICVSTVFVKQHSVLDIIAALPISAVAWLICFRRKERHSKKKRERGAVAWFAA